MYKVALRKKSNVKREFETLEQAVNYALYIEGKFIDDNVFILDDSGKDITEDIEY